ncbi:hypothetical protein [Mangrovibacterium lignilyticum]|uniref:hypothetical protein n=1 Tax=Mangrovibacterium lignilyticum TaxID=2668052 RepID=UPI0013D1F6CB|nr:hypothetical protein [Mangrovibacterium lignilyticum]
MKTNKPSKKNFKHSDIEKTDIGGQIGKGAKRDKSGKKRLSIYDEFEDEDYDLTNYKREDDDLYDEEDEEY